MNLENKQEAKVALVTGAARRIGAVVVKALHASGYRVVIHCRTNLAEAHALALILNQQRMDSVLVLQRELRESVAAEELITTINDWAGRLDLLVNNASVFRRNDVDCFNESAWDELFAIHVKAPYLLSLAARPLLALHAGSIVNITDIHAERPLKGYAVYCQSKAALEMQTKALALEFAPNVRVNAVAPGAIMWPEGDNSASDAQQQKIIANTPLNRHGDPDFIAQAVLALAQNEFVTGQIWKIDGGRSL